MRPFELIDQELLKDFRGTLDMSQLAEVCNAVMPLLLVLMYSMMSTSPVFGQSGPRVQNAGHSEHPLLRTVPAVLGM
jgi:hypothetical protein